MFYDKSLNSFSIITYKMGEIVDDYYENPVTQEEYKDRVEIIIGEIKRIYGKSLKVEVHLPMIRELVQSEIACRRYSKEIANDREGDQAASLLKNERMQMNRLREQLGISMSKVEKSMNDRGRDNDDEMDEIMNEICQEAIDNGDLDIEALKKEMNEDDSN